MATMSKRAQARTERELQDLLNIPGNSTCADCGGRNPAWASWSLGIFLCMRCATIHRKLGTHISKVKSLSMDTWTNDQVEVMKRNGNTFVNKIYNPSNKKPDMPLDADEVDNAMERFIRKKYQEKTLANGRPPVPSRDDPSTMRSKSPDIPPPTALPSKKGKFFGFGLRASSSAYPFSKSDKKKKDEPRVDGAFRIASEEYTSTPRSGGRTEMSDQDLQIKLGQLHDMGFTDYHMNTKMLKKANGDVGRATEALVKLGPSDRPQRKRTPDIVIPNRDPERSQKPAPTSAQMSNNPFDQLDEPSKQTGFGISLGDQQQQQQQPTAVSTNPWQNTTSVQPNTGLEQSFAGMQVAQPLFPHNTGGYNPQMRNDARYQQTLTPPVPSIPQQWSTNTSPVIGTNPFAQQPLSSQSTGNNPYANHMHQTMPGFAPSTNPFFQQQMSTGSQQQSPSALINPFGLPPSQSPPQPQVQPNLGQSSSIFDAPQQQNQGYQNQQYSQQTQYQQQSPVGSSPGFSTFQYGQPQPQSQNQYQYSPQVQQQQPQQKFTNVQPPYNNPYQQQQPQALSPQQTGRYAKNDILALFNYPTLAPQKPLASIPEPTEIQQQPQQQLHQQLEQHQTQFQPQQQQYQPQTRQPLSQAPSNIYSNPTNNNAISQAKRSVTMPVSNSSNRNPFLQTGNSNTSSLASTPITSQFTQNPNPNSNPYHQQQYQQQIPQQQNYDFSGSNNNSSGGLGNGVGAGNNGYRHASADSVSVNNPNLSYGRHSPDAFASLSARSMR